MKLDENDPAHGISIAILFHVRNCYFLLHLTVHTVQKARTEFVPVEQWDGFIAEAFSRPELYVDPKKLKKRKDKGFKNRLAEKARQQQYYLSQWNSFVIVSRVIAQKRHIYERNIEIIKE